MTLPPGTDLDDFLTNVFQMPRDVVTLFLRLFGLIFAATSLGVDLSTGAQIVPGDLMVGGNLFVAGLPSGGSGEGGEQTSVLTQILQRLQVLEEKTSTLSCFYNPQTSRTTTTIA
jgi:hypothetical protein